MGSGGVGADQANKPGWRQSFSMRLFATSRQSNFEVWVPFPCLSNCLIPFWVLGWLFVMSSGLEREH
eukprot:2156757-Amphidinium_carterae.1